LVLFSCFHSSFSCIVSIIIFYPSLAPQSPISNLSFFVLTVALTALPSQPNQSILPLASTLLIHATHSHGQSPVMAHVDRVVSPSMTALLSFSTKESIGLDRSDFEFHVNDRIANNIQQQHDTLRSIPLTHQLDLDSHAHKCGISNWRSWAEHSPPPSATHPSVRQLECLTHHPR
jgi:hypothetical protein